MTPIPPVSALRPLNILFVDDEMAVLRMMSLLMRSGGHTLGLTSSGPEAIEKFKSQEWDVVLTDRAMSEMDGEALSREIKRLSPRTPVIMVTGFAPLTKCATVDAVVAKPFTRATILEAIRRCLAANEDGLCPGNTPLPAAA